MALRSLLWLVVPVLTPVVLDGLDLDSVPKLFSEVAERNQIRESQLREYSVVRIYEVTNASGRVRAQSKVLVRYEWPNPKNFQVLEEQGPHVFQSMVFGPLMEHEAKTSAGDAKHDSAITPANYDVELKGEEEIDGRKCYVLRALPRRHDKYLFDGTIWVDVQDLAIARIEGRPAKSPSFWVKKVQFVRRYEKLGDFWLPREDSSVSDVKIFGKHTLTIRYDDYTLGDRPAQEQGRSLAQ